MLSTHVLDISRGRPASGIGVELYRLHSSARTLVAQAATDGDGRIAAPFGGTLEPGVYELCFRVAEYYEDCFFELIPIRFRITERGGKYHVPLLLSPYGYTTYRGS